MYVNATVEQLCAVSDLMMATTAQEAILMDLGEGRLRARCYGTDELMFSLLVDEGGVVHDLQASGGAEP